MDLRRLILIALVLLLSVEVYADGGRNHQIRQARPIRLGTSGGNNRDITSRFCCSGTLGALVRDSSGRKYILSNNHVIAKSNNGRIGQDVGQPGLIDVNCRVADADPVANLSAFVTIVFNRANKVDAAIARINPGRVNDVGRILDIGRPGPPIEAALDSTVKKSGRTSGKTVGRIIALNTTVFVGIPKSCDDEEGRTARFIDQFVIETINDRPFTESGDSGSLIVRRTRTCPRSVGLLFAGDEQGIGIANRIQNVLSALNVSIVGCPGTSSAETKLQGTRLDPAILKAEEIRQRNEEKLLRIPGVVGVGIGRDQRNPIGSSIVVFALKDSAAARTATAIPAQVEGIATRVILTSGFKSRARKSCGKKSHVKGQEKERSN